MLATAQNCHLMPQSGLVNRSSFLLTKTVLCRNILSNPVQVECCASLRDAAEVVDEPDLCEVEMYRLLGLRVCLVARCRDAGPLIDSSK